MSATTESFAATTRVVPLTEVVQLNPRPPRGALPDDLEVSFVPMAAVEAATGNMDATLIRPYGEVKKGYTVFHEGDVLFAKITPCMENGKMAVARNLRNGVGCGSTEFHVLRPKPGVDASYIYHFVSSARFRGEAAHHMTGAVGQKRVPAAFLEQCEIPLPDLKEQRRIVAEIELQFSRLEEGLANLKRINASLKRFKASVINAAVEGRLVGERSNHGQSSDPRGLRDGVPRSWRRTTVGELAVLVEYGTSAKTSDIPEGVPVLRMGNIVDGGVSLDNLKYLPTNHEEFPKLLLKRGDLLFNRTNSSELVGKTAVFEGSPAPCSFASYLIRVRLSDECRPEFISAFINSRRGRQWVKSVVTQQVGQANVNGSKLKQLVVPLPPYVEQCAIVEELERQLRYISGLHKAVQDNFIRLQGLRRQILARAFQAKRR